MSEIAEQIEDNAPILSDSDGERFVVARKIMRWRIIDGRRSSRPVPRVRFPARDRGGEIVEGNLRDALRRGYVYSRRSTAKGQATRLGLTDQF